MRESDGPNNEFEVGGLQERAYRLRILDPRTLQLHVTEPIAAGSTGLLLRLPAVLRRARLSGRVLDSSGDPVPGADMQVEAFDPTDGSPRRSQ